MILHHRASLALFSLLIAANVLAQPLKPGEWRTYTSMRDVTALALSSDSTHVWVATTGGAFRVNIRDTTEPLLAVRTNDGLTENNLTAIASDQNGNIFFGGSTGGFDVWNSATGSVQKLGGDIRNSTYPVKTINSIAIGGDTIFLATGFGISTFIFNDPGYFGVTVNHIGSFNPQDSVRQVIIADGTIYAAMPEGLAYARLSSDLGNGGNWTTLPDTVPVVALAHFDGKIFFGTPNGLFQLSADTFISVPVPGVAVIDRLSASTDSLYILDISGTIYSTHDFQNFSVQSLADTIGSSVTAMLPGVSSPAESLIVGSSSNGVSIFERGQLYSNFFPQGPVNNYVFNLNFSSSTGILYGVNLLDGFELFHPDGDNWQTYPQGVGIGNVSYRYVFYDSIRMVTWFSTHGNGLIRVSNLGSPTQTWNIIDNPNGGLPSTKGANYIVAGSGGLTTKGDFMVTTWAQNLQGLSITSDGTQFTDYRLATNSSDPAGLGQSFGCVTQDIDGNFWVGTEREVTPAPYGVFWVRASDHAFGSIEGGAGGLLANPVVNAILVDQDDEVWCGTEGGVQIISNPYAINDPNPKFSVRTVPLLTNQLVHTMAVDGVGNKWIGTENGIFVVSPDGTDSIARYSTDNSPLVDNTVLSIAMDLERGEAYAATPSGISRFSTIFKQGKPDYTNIRVYPNPVVQSSDFAPQIYIDGLVAGSTVKIFTLNMKLVATVDGSALGSTVPWNGRDDLGRQIPSGIYLVTATSPQSGQNGEAKVVIVRKP
ncbi:MAG TPA: hypothetical protein VG537_10920 [Candidatus Kapabacteria bacterium]|jgi:ligand-binding sensor domain-containing protein|nr:hypothetical protein [Candidatus Kapabacteria bacterium]